MKVRTPLLGGLLLGVATTTLEAQERGARVPPCEAARDEAHMGADRDADGLSDACELGLARAFAPVLMVRAAGCNWDTSVRPARPGGGYLHAVQRAGATVRVAYLPAYFRDLRLARREVLAAGGGLLTARRGLGAHRRRGLA